VKTNAGFDLLAPIYDSLACLVFGRTIHDSQVWFLDRVAPNSTVLILGGGTGWLLEELLNRCPTAIVYYIEASSKMIEKSRQRNLRNSVHFILGTEESIPSDLTFDIVITNFYVDLFPTSSLNKIIKEIHSHTTASSTWVVTDFVNEKWWHRWMLKIMYFFFRIVCRIEGSHLPEWPKAIYNQGWKEVDSKRWYRNFIISTIWNRR
jgi:ubiquinone/menaquinone biosynthesis C-methylase UbiE